MLKITHKEAQKMIDKGRIECNGAIFSQKAGFLSGEIIVNHFRAEATELKPIFETADFALFDKPAGLLTHPKGRFSHASLLDSIRFHLGANANPINRLDSETSGLVIVSKNKKSEVILKRYFEMREVEKTYLAVVFGRINIANLAQKFGKSIITTRKSNADSHDFIIDLPLKDGQKGVDLGIRTCIDKNGRFAQSAIKILHYDSARNITHLKITPLTGRTHQIRAHLAHIGYRIVGEMLYGVEDKNARDFLDGKISGEARTQIFGANRLMLHAQSLRFCYQSNEFFIRSKMPFSLPPNSHFVDCGS
ncbi:RluA family pseudouridine synthase [Helicobacter sp. 23-1045]